MTFHPAFWTVGAEENGLVSGMWHGRRVTVRPASPDRLPEGILAAIAGPSRALAADYVAEALAACRDNLDTIVLEEVRRCAVAGEPGLIELAHLMIGLPKHAVIAAGHAADAPASRLLTQLSGFWMLRAEPWRAILRELTGDGAEQLRPRPATAALQACLEELAGQDLCAYLTAVHSFGLPGDERRIKDLADAACVDNRLAGQLDVWAATSTGSPAGYELTVLALENLPALDEPHLHRTVATVQSVAETVALFGSGIGNPRAPTAALKVPDLYYMPLWATMGRNPEARNLLYGWAVENYHFHDGLPGYLTAARIIARASGSVEDPGQSRPLGPTSALSRCLRRAAHLHPFVQLTCAATLEGAAVRLEETRDFFGHLAEVMELPAAAVAPFIAHAEQQQRLDPAGKLRELFPDVTPELMDTAVRQAHDFVELYRLWQERIVEHYRFFPAGHGAAVIPGAC